jgi:hypothetical protein
VRRFEDGACEIAVGWGLLCGFGSKNGEGGDSIVKPSGNHIDDFQWPYLIARDLSKSQSASLRRC